MVLAAGAARGARRRRTLDPVVVTATKVETPAEQTAPP